MHFRNKLVISFLSCFFFQFIPDNLCISSLIQMEKRNINLSTCESKLISRVSMILQTHRPTLHIKCPLRTFRPTSPIFFFNITVSIRDKMLIFIIRKSLNVITNGSMHLFQQYDRGSDSAYTPDLDHCVFQDISFYIENNRFTLQLILKRGPPLPAQHPLSCAGLSNGRGTRSHEIS